MSLPSLVCGFKSLLQASERRMSVEDFGCTCRTFPGLQVTLGLLFTFQWPRFSHMANVVCVSRKIRHEDDEQLAGFPQLCSNWIHVGNLPEEQLLPVPSMVTWVHKRLLAEE